MAILARLHLQEEADLGSSQNDEKITHKKGRLLEQAVILFNCIPFQNWNFY